PISQEHRHGRGDGDDRATEAVDADAGGNRRQRPVDLGVAERQPRKSGEGPAAGEFADHPAGGERPDPRQGGCDAAARRRREAFGKCQRAGAEKRQVGRQQEHGGGRQRRCEATIAMHADVEPADAGAEAADPERIAGDAGAGHRARRWCRDQREQRRERDDRQPPSLRGREARCVQQAEGERSGARWAKATGRQAGLARLRAPRTRRMHRRGTQDAAPAGAVSPLPMRVTSSNCTWRASARRTSKRRPASSTASPRRGTRPSFPVTRPPTVSKSSSSSWVPRTWLNCAISVMARTRYRWSPGTRSTARMWSLSSSKSNSSSMSPTICSSTSSIVTRPATPPYSSTTTARWLRL